jgi:hypothetical protein
LGIRPSCLKSLRELSELVSCTLALGLTREHLVEGFSSARCYANDSFVAAGMHFYCLEQFVINIQITVETPLLDFHLRGNDFLGFVA